MSNTPELIKLPDGTHADAFSVTTISPIEGRYDHLLCVEFQPRVVIQHSGYHTIVECQSFEHARSLADSIALDVRTAKLKSHTVPRHGKNKPRVKAKSWVPQRKKVHSSL